MPDHIHTRTRMLLGAQGLARLKQSHVAIVGLGGVGGHCAEALARAGVGRLFLLDGDSVDITNLNRQLIATKRTLGIEKSAAMRARIEEVSDCDARAVTAFLLEENAHALLPGDLDFIVDAVDTVAAKVALMAYAFDRGVRLVSAMGAGNRLDPTAIGISSLYETSGCPLARAVRQAARKRGLPSFPVAVSSESAIDTGAGRTPGSISFVPSAMGLALAGYVVRSLTDVNVSHSPNQ